MSKFKNILSFLQSLKFRLIILLILIGSVPVLVLRAGVLNTYGDLAISIKTSEILSQAKILANQIVTK